MLYLLDKPCSPSQTDYNYMMEENMIANTMEEKDLGIIIDNKLNFQNNINKHVNKANQKLGLINRSFKYMDKDMFLQLFTSSLVYQCPLGDCFYLLHCLLLQTLWYHLRKVISCFLMRHLCIW
jgi:hypothetical protein